MCICDFIVGVFTILFELTKAVFSAFLMLPTFSRIILVFVILSISFAMYIYDKSRENNWNQ